MMITEVKLTQYLNPNLQALSIPLGFKAWYEVARHVSSLVDWINKALNDDPIVETLNIGHI